MLLEQSNTKQPNVTTRNTIFSPTQAHFFNKLQLHDPLTLFFPLPRTIVYCQLRRQWPLLALVVSYLVQSYLKIKNLIFHLPNPIPASSSFFLGSLNLPFWLTTTFGQYQHSQHSRRLSALQSTNQLFSLTLLRRIGSRNPGMEPAKNMHALHSTSFIMVN